MNLDWSETGALIAQDVVVSGSAPGRYSQKSVIKRLYVSINGKSTDFQHYKI